MTLDPTGRLLTQNNALAIDGPTESEPSHGPLNSNKRKRKPSATTSAKKSRNPQKGPSIPLIPGPSSDGTSDQRERRTFEKVNFSFWQVTTWYHSPYPIARDGSDLTPSTFAPNIVDDKMGRTHTRVAEIKPRDKSAQNASNEELEGVLWVCDRCFKYMADGKSWELHARNCTVNNPPGEEVHRRGTIKVWEVDGAKAKLYCQNLGLFGKLFIKEKTLFFDCDNVLFYVLTDADHKRDHVVGFFSKEKVSYEDYNLACIVTFPPYQHRGYGVMMIDFSYELSRKQGKAGTPEKPLSALGLRSYLRYWIATLVRFFRRILSVAPSFGPCKTPRVLDQNELDQSTESRGDLSEAPRKKKKRDKDEGQELSSGIDYSNRFDESKLTPLRQLRMVLNPNGSVTTHLVIECTLEDISAATFLHVEDIAFALFACGLVAPMNKPKQAGEPEMLVISREMVEKVAVERKLD